LVLLLGIGLWGEKKFSGSYRGFVAAGKSLGAWVTAISAAASSESAWVMLGLSGVGYSKGIAGYWSAFACILGYFFNALWIMVPLRKMSGRLGSLTLSDFMESRLGDKSHLLRMVSAAVIAFFMLTYVIAQFTGSGKTLEGMHIFSYQGGVVVGGLIIAVYVLMGGYAAVSVTDLVQGLLMATVMILFPIYAFVKVGGIAPLVNFLDKEGLLTLTGKDLTFWGSLGFVVGALGISLGYPGMPHVVVRFITVRDEKEARRAALISITWAIFVLFGSVSLGIATRVLIPGLSDPEQALPNFARQFLHPVIAGVVLSAITAAIMSTADSQLMYSATTIVNDLWWRLKGERLDEKNSKKFVLYTRLVIAVMAYYAMALALFKARFIYSFVLYAWSALGAAFSPILIYSLYWRKFNRWGALASMITGPLVTVIWHNIPKLASTIYELVPAFIFSMVVGWFFSIITEEEVDTVWESEEK
jgi:sodium/proline symporter